MDYKKRIVSFILLMVMVINGPLLVIATNIDYDFEEVNILDKIDDRVLEAFKEEDYVETIVYLKNQLDERDVYDEEDVVDDLRELSEEEQRQIIDYLDEKSYSGDVITYKSYFIINGLYLSSNYEVVEELAGLPEVEKIYINEEIKIEEPEITDEVEINNNMLFSANNDDIEWNLKHIGVDKVWNEFGVDGSGITVGIIDSGVTGEHPALLSKWRGYNKNNPENMNYEGNWYDATANTEFPYDDYMKPHGTHVTGTILGSDKDNKIGVAPGAQWIAARAFTTKSGYSNWLLSAGEWMIAPNGNKSLAPDIINNSWGGNIKDAEGKNEWYRQMVKSWRMAGILPVFAAGNELAGEAPAGSIAVPADYPESFAVGAVDSNNRLARFSQRGPSAYENGIKPNIVAPGKNIRSSIVTGYTGPGEGWDGTSMAAPHIAGVAALMLSANRELSVDEIENIMMETADELGDERYTEHPNQAYGYGLINAYEAVSKAIGNNSIVAIEGRVIDSDNKGIDAKVSIYKTINDEKKLIEVTRTDEENGEYYLKPSLVKNDNILMVIEALGYEDKVIEINIGDNDNILKNIVMDRKDKSIYEGYILDGITNKYVQGAEVILVDKFVKRDTITNNRGYFKFREIPTSIEKIVIKADGYVTKEINIEDFDNTDNINIYRREDIFTKLVYDNGNYGKGFVDENSGIDGIITGMIAKMETEKPGILKGVEIFFADRKYPLPGGDEIGITILDSKNKVEEDKLKSIPKFYNIERGAWNYIDLSDQNIIVKDKFYVSTIQEKTFDKMPAIGLDNSGIYADDFLVYNSIGKINSVKELYKGEYIGIPMIRSIVDTRYSIAKIKDNKYITRVDKETYDLQILSKNLENIKVLNNNKEVFVDSFEGDKIIPLNLNKGNNNIQVFYKDGDSWRFADELVVKYGIQEYKPTKPEETGKEESKDDSNLGSGSSSGTGSGGSTGGVSPSKPQEPNENKPKPPVKEGEAEITDPIDKDKEVDKNKTKFKDLDKFDWAKEAINHMSKKGVVKGKEENKFKPNDSITRAEFSTMVVRLLNLNSNNDREVPFKDVKSNDWYFENIKIAYDNGLINGRTKDSFKPDDNITREEVAKIISIILDSKDISPEDKEILVDYKDSKDISVWAKDSVKLVSELKIVNGFENKFNPKNNTTRAEAVVILYRLDYIVNNR